MKANDDVKAVLFLFVSPSFAKTASLLLKVRISVRHKKWWLTDLSIFTEKPAGDAMQDLEMMIEEKGATIHIAKLPATVGDERMIRQLFENIIGNALKYSKESTPPVINVESSKGDGFVELSFTDNGIGFNEEYLPKMFNLFQRLHNRETYEGTGLGLAICRKITDLHGGKIWAKGREKQGATFFVSLPLNTSAD